MFAKRIENAREVAHRPNNGRKEGATTLELLLTGERHEDHYHVVVYGEPIIVACASLIACVDLVVARHQGVSGFTHISKRTIFRLRQAIDAAVGKGAGMRLIETGSTEEYRVTIPKFDMTHRVGYTPCFFELVHLDIISADQAESIRYACKLCESNSLRQV